MSELLSYDLDDTIIIEIIRGRKKIYRCEKCKFITTNKTKAYEHMMTYKHRAMYDPNFKKIKEKKVVIPVKKFCEVCNKHINEDYFETHLKRDYHIKKEKGIKYLPCKLKCEICGGKEYDKYFYEIHLMSNKHINNEKKLQENNKVIEVTVDSDNTDTEHIYCNDNVCDNTEHDHI